MRKFLSLRLSVAALPFLFASLLQAAEDDRTGMAAAPDELARLLTLKIDGDRLCLDRDAWVEKEKEKDGDPNQGGNANLQVNIQGGNAVVINQRMMMAGRRNMQPPIPLFQRYMQKASPRNMGNSMNSSNTRCSISQQGEVNGTCSIDSATNEFELRLAEQPAPHRSLHVEEDPASGLTIRLVQPDTREILLLVQAPHGTVSVTSIRGDEVVCFSARNFTELLKKSPAEVQTLLFRPLRELGPQEPLSEWLPPVMALACTGFGPAPEAIARQADALIAQLGNDDPETRERATQALIRLYPQAVGHIAQVAEQTTDAEAKMRLSQVLAAHPTIARTRAFVEEKKLHEDKAYLREILSSVPFFKDAARARLTQLYGKDYGDDPAQWP